jgi:hypothetical protein
MLAYRQVAALVPATIPIVLESIVAPDFVDDEMEAARESLDADSPRPQIRTRRSGATPRPLHA